MIFYGLKLLIWNVIPTEGICKTSFKPLSSSFQLKTNNKISTLTQGNGHISDKLDGDNGVGLPIDVGQRNWEGVVAELGLLMIRYKSPITGLLYLISNFRFYNHTFTICWTSRMAGIHSEDLVKLS